MMRSCLCTFVILRMASATAVRKITLFTHTACPFAQRVWIALEASQIEFDKVDVNLCMPARLINLATHLSPKMISNPADGSGGFDKRQLKAVEAAGGLPPKGYIPVMRIGDEVIRESSVLVDRVAELSDEVPGATSLAPDDRETARKLVHLCNTLPKSPRSVELDELFRTANEAVASFGDGFLAGKTFSVADACLLPFLQRVEDTIPNDAEHLRCYMERIHKHAAFAKTVVSSWWWWW